MVIAYDVRQHEPDLQQGSPFQCLNRSRNATGPQAMQEFTMSIETDSSHSGRLALPQACPMRNEPAARFLGMPGIIMKLAHYRGLLSTAGH